MRIFEERTHKNFQKWWQTSTYMPKNLRKVQVKENYITVKLLKALKLKLQNQSGIKGMCYIYKTNLRIEANFLLETTVLSKGQQKDDLKIVERRNCQPKF